MLTLRRSYLAKAPGSRVHQIKLPSSLGAARLGRLEDFFRRALAPTPAERFANAEEMKVALLAALDVQPADPHEVAALIAEYEPQPRRPDSTELNAFRPADLTESNQATE